MPRFPKIIVTGGRDYTNKKRVKEVLEAFNPDTIVEGGATGVDALCAEWAEYNNKKLITVEAEWATYGRAAGMKRNRKMLAAHMDAPLVAFPGGRGTYNCVQAAVEFGMTVLIVEDK